MHNNIAPFGGDPNKITLWGQSSGALSADYYNFAYPNNGLVAGFILSSGTAYFPSQNTDSTHSNFTYAASRFGCNDLSPAEELGCMRKIPYSKLKSYFQDPNAITTYDFLAIADHKTVFPVLDYPHRITTGNFSRKICCFQRSVYDEKVEIPSF